MNTRRNLVAAAQAAIRKGGDTRMLKRQLLADNPYAHALLRSRGLEYRDGAIRRRDDR